MTSGYLGVNEFWKKYSILYIYIILLLLLCNKIKIIKFRMFQLEFRIPILLIDLHLRSYTI